MTKDITLEECSKNSLMHIDISRRITELLGIIWIVTLVMINFGIAGDIMYIISAGIMLALWLSYNMYEFIKKNNL